MDDMKFQQEVDTLMRVEHKNIVRFLGYCSDTQGKMVKQNEKKNVMAEERQRFLCFEYLPWTLDKYIKDPPGGHEWRTFYRIIKGICKGLHYLHQQNIVHLDLKPANILLDYCTVPKISDFGLSKRFDENQTRTITLNLYGTLGYMAPELYGGQVTLKSDIYSLGIIIFKILTGNKGCPAFSKNKGCPDIDSVVERWRIKMGMSPEDVQLNPVRVCAEIGIECIDDNPEKRPDTRCILERLDKMEITYGVMESYLGTSSETNVLESWRNNFEASTGDAQLEPVRVCTEIATECADFNPAKRPDTRRILERLDEMESTYGVSEMADKASYPVQGITSRVPTRPGVASTELNIIMASNAASDDDSDSNSDSDDGGPSPFGARVWRTWGMFWQKLSLVTNWCQRSRPSWFKDDPATEFIFSFSQLAAATKGFALEVKIGEGSFGTVYHDKLPDGREVAIIRGESGPSTRRFGEVASVFWSEVAALCHFQHKHLVALLGYCNENEECLLVYEYLKNGTLYDLLHPKATASPSSLSPVMSSWKLRIKILLDASRSIEDLHMYEGPHIVLHDIKSSNILLDADWTARVWEFGQSLTGPDVEKAPSQTVEVVGTVGYLDPQFFNLSHMTKESDVYRFVVLMLEVVTGKRAILNDKKVNGGNPVSLVKYAVPSIVAGELGKVLDPRMPEPAASEFEAFELVANTAVHCVRVESKDRPAITDIVAKLDTAFQLLC